MKENKKALQLDLKKELKHGDKLEKLVVDFALRKTAGSREDLDGVYYSQNGRQVLMASKSLSGKYTVCEGVREIDADSFWGCAYLEGIELPEGVEKIGEKASSGNRFIRRVTLPKSLRVIDDEAFFGCSSLSEICLPKSIENIGYCAFADCMDNTARHAMDYRFSKC